MNEKLIIALSIMLLAGMVGAQENMDVAVVAGATTESEMVTLDEAPSDTLGAIISSIESTYTRFVDFAGVNVWQEQIISQEQIFDLLVVPTDQIVMGAITQGVLFETSETVDVGTCIGCTFSTYEASYSEGLVDKAIVFSGSTTPCPVSGTLTKIGSGHTDEGVLGCAYSNGVEGEDSFMFDLNGSGIIELEEEILYDYLEEIPITVYDQFQIMDLGVGIYEYSSDITQYGKMTSAQLGESLLITEAGTYDIYGIMP